MVIIRWIATSAMAMRNNPLEFAIWSVEINICKKNVCVVCVDLFFISTDKNFRLSDWKRADFMTLIKARACLRVLETAEQHKSGFHLNVRNSQQVSSLVENVPHAVISKFNLVFSVLAMKN